MKTYLKLKDQVADPPLTSPSQSRKEEEERIETNKVPMNANISANLILIHYL